MKEIVEKREVEELLGCEITDEQLEIRCSVLLGLELNPVSRH